MVLERARGAHRDRIRWLYAGRLSIVVIALVAFYAYFIEPAWISVTHLDVDLGLTSPIKIVHLTDLHTRAIGRREENLIALIDQERPDLILITGDSVNGDGTFEDAALLIAQLHAPLGVWISAGNWEGWIPRPRRFEVFEKAGAQVLINQTALVRSDLALMGVDDLLSGTPAITGLASRAPKDAKIIAMIHEPVLFEQIAGSVPLVLAGHSHGGQVRIPFLPPLWLPPGSGSYVEGWFTSRGSRMYVSRGIGNSLLELRFNCRPELVVLSVK